MKKIIFYCVCSLLFSVTLNAQKKKVVGYFADWANTSVISTLNYKALTTIDYAFAIPNNAGVLSGYNGTKITSLVNAAHPHGVKVNISIGGYGNSSSFAPICANAGIKTTFIKNIIDLLANYDLDGVDLDWEYPSSGDAAAFESLVIDLRNELDAAGTKKSKYYELTAAVPVGSNASGVTNTAISYMDYLNIMSYDDSHAGNADHSSVLFAKSCIEYWKNTRGIAAAKLVLGVPFYTYQDNFQISYSSLSASDPSAAYNDADGVFFNAVKNYTYKVNSKPILDQKGDLVITTYGLAGMMIWELSQDRTDNYSLLNAVGLKMGTITGVEELDSQSQLAVYPNPFNDKVYISFPFTVDENSKISIVLYDISGKEIDFNSYVNQKTVELSEISIPGMYFGKITTNDGNTHSFKIVRY